MRNTWHGYQKQLNKKKIGDWLYQYFFIMTLCALVKYYLCIYLNLDIRLPCKLLFVMYYMLRVPYVYVFSWWWRESFPVLAHLPIAMLLVNMWQLVLSLWLLVYKKPSFFQVDSPLSTLYPTNWDIITIVIDGRCLLMAHTLYPRYVVEDIYGTLH